MSEQPIRPFPGVGVQGSVEVVFADSLGVDDVGHTLHALESLQSLQKNAPGHALPAARGPHHHQAVVNLSDLIELENLRPKGPESQPRKEWLRLLGHIPCQQARNVHYELLTASTGIFSQTEFYQM